MAIATILKPRANGLDAPQVRVEVDIASGLPALTLVGLPETVVKESKDRVRSAIVNSNFELPPGRITVNLAPADLPKEGGRFDLPIAIGMLVASGQLPAEAAMRCEFYGELSLSGELQSVTGTLPAALAAGKAGHSLVVPYGNAQETHGERLRRGDGYHLLDVCAHLTGSRLLEFRRGSASASARPSCRIYATCAVKLKPSAPWKSRPLANIVCCFWVLLAPAKHARAALAGHSAAAHRSRSVRSRRRALDFGPFIEVGRVGRATVSITASHSVGCCTRRWRIAPTARRNFARALRRFIFGRVARV